MGLRSVSRAAFEDRLDPIQYLDKVRAATTLTPGAKPTLKRSWGVRPNPIDWIETTMGLRVRGTGGRLIKSLYEYRTPPAIELARDPGSRRSVTGSPPEGSSLGHPRSGIAEGAPATPALRE